MDDDKVRAGHTALNGTLRQFADSPDPGEDFNCRCWAEHVPDPYTDAIYPSMSPLDLIGGGLFTKGGIKIGQPILKIIKEIIGKKHSLNSAQLENLGRFIKKIPANSKNNIKIIYLPKGNIKFTTISPGKVPGSKAVYEKTVNSKGRTIMYIKNTYGKNGDLIHSKNKINGKK